MRNPPPGIPSLRDPKPVAQFPGRELLTVDWAALREFLRARERYSDRLETGVAHELRGNLKGVSVVARDGNRHWITRTMCFFREVAHTHRVERRHYRRSFEVGRRGVADAFFLRLLQKLVAVASCNRIGGIEHNLAGELWPVFFGKVRNRLVRNCHKEDVTKIDGFANRSGLGKRAKAIDKRLDLFGVARREQNLVSRLDPQSPDRAANIAGTDDAYLELAVCGLREGEAWQ